MSIDGAIDAQRLVGDWALERWESVGDDGSVAWPMGQVVEGILVYSPDGTMITTIAPADRPRLSSPDPLVGGPDDERRVAAETFVAYAGRFHVAGSQVVHEVEMSLYPNWVGTRQARHVRLAEQDTVLELSTDPFTLGGRRAVQRLTWTRSRRQDQADR
ncbi:MAG: lipocalin-like domain-containing protein [Chloroflexi bacterium]|nr:lipocalin-like domain-containing protein [Chloroflexota bacterium]